MVVPLFEFWCQNRISINDVNKFWWQIKKKKKISDSQQPGSLKHDSIWFIWHARLYSDLMDFEIESENNALDHL